MTGTDPTSTQPSLGQLISSHNRRPVNQRLHWALIVISLIAAVICGGIALERGYDAYQHFGPAQVSRWMGRWLLGFAAAGSVALLSIRALRRWRGFQLDTFTQGLRIRTQETTSTIRWKEISGVYASAVRYGLAGLVWGRRTYLALETYQNSHIDISPSLNGIETLAEIIKQHVYPLLLEEYQQQQEVGQSLQFGGILLTPSAVTTPSGDLSWSELTEVTLHNGVITLESNQSNGGGRLRLATRNVPNIELLIQFIRRMGKLV